MPRIETWERNPNKEGEAAFQAFTVYRDMDGERSLRGVAKQLEKSLTIIARWSTTHHWVRRVAAYDAHMQRIHLKAQAKAREEMSQRHAKLASALQAKLAQRLQTLDAETLSPRDIAYWLEVTTKVERQARGEPDKHEVSGPDGGPIEVVNLGVPEQRERLAQLVREASRRLEDGDDQPTEDG